MVLDWRFKEKVMLEVEKYSGHILDKEFKTHLSENVEYCYSDNMDFLPDKSYLIEFINSFRNYYTDIKAFHGCRPVSLKPYFSYGLLGQNKKKIEQLFFEIFSDFDLTDLEECVARHSAEFINEEGKIFFVCNDAELTEDSGHYLIQGSEYLQALATSLTIKNNHICDYKRRLRDYGIPTVIEVDIPISIVPERQIIEFCKMIISKWCNILLKVQSNGGDEMCLTLRNKLEPKYIKNHYHPKKIIDPHNNNTVYISKNTYCDMCE